MFVIPCKYNKDSNIFNLVEQIQKYHNKPEILVVDSDSEDKEYFNKLKDNGVLVEDAKNRNYHIGAYWFAYHNFKKDFYYFLHDSCNIKDNLDFLKHRKFTALGYFLGGEGGDYALNHLYSLTPYRIKSFPVYCIYSSIFFTSREIMDRLASNGMDKLLPTHTMWSESPGNGPATYALDGAYGIALENEGIDVSSNTLLGDLQKDGAAWITGANTSWQHPVEKFFMKRA